MEFKLENQIYYCKEFENDVEVLFIMESPFAEELNEGFPCMGNSGIEMSKALELGDEALGRLLLNGREKRFAIFETFNFALDTRACASVAPEDIHNFWDVCDLPWCGLKIQDKSIGNKLEIKKLKRGGSYDRKAHYESLWDYIFCIDANVRNAFFEKYANILNPIIKKEKFPNLKEIVVCGFIAQSVFMVAFEKNVFPYNKPFFIKKCLIPVRFLNHPSCSLQNHQEWSYSLP